MREITLIDLFWNWTTHWRSFCVTLLVGFIIGIFVMSISSTRQTVNAELDAEDDRSLTSSDISSSTDSIDTTDIESVVRLYNNYQQLLNEYDTFGDSLPLVEKTEIESNLSLSYYYIRSIMKSLDIQSVARVMRLINQQTSNNDRNEVEDHSSGNVTDSESYNSLGNNMDLNNRFIKCVICILGAVFIHFFICSILYMFNSKLTISDDLETMFGCKILSRTIRDEYNTRKGMDSYIYKHWIGLSNISTYDDAQILNADIIANVAKQNCIKSVLLVYGGLSVQADELKELLGKMNKDLNVASMESFRKYFLDYKNTKEVSGVVLIVGIRQTDIRELKAEIQNLMVRNIPILGIVEY